MLSFEKFIPTIREFTGLNKEVYNIIFFATRSAIEDGAIGNIIDHIVLDALVEVL